MQRAGTGVLRRESPVVPVVEGPSRRALEQLERFNRWHWLAWEGQR